MKIIMKTNIIPIVESKKGLMEFMTEIFGHKEGDEVIIHKIFDEENIVITHAQIKNKGQYYLSIDRFTYYPKKEA